MTDTTDVETEITETKKSTKEITVVHDQAFFQHETGDTYHGFFEAKKKDRIAKMHGLGVYTTAEGDSYSGTWDADRLGANDHVTISYADGSQYEGYFKDWYYTGQGNYHYPDGSILQSEFVDSSPVGHMVVVDPNGHIWMGGAQQGYGWVEPVNHFYEMLEKTRETGKTKKRAKHSNKVM